MENPDILRRTLERERKARKAAEKLLEAKSLELHAVNHELLELNKALEERVQERTHELSSTTLRLKTLIESLQDAILVEDENRSIAVVNQRFCDLFGIPAQPSDLLGIDCSQAGEQSKHLFKDPQGFLNGVDKLLKAQKLALGGELEFTDGKILKRDYIPINMEGKYLGHLWRYVDFTKEKSQQDAINAIAKFPSEAPYGVLRFDFEMKLTYSNQIGNDFCEMLNSESLVTANEKFYEEVETVLKKGVRKTWEIALGDLWYQVFIVPIPEQQYTNVYVIDNTLLKQVERDLVKAREAAEASANAKEIFLANMSHEIRTPMNAILGMARLMDNSPLDPTQERYLSVIRNSSENLLVVINDILDFSKIEAGMMTIEEKPFNLNAWLNQLHSSQAHRAREKGIEFLTEIDPDLPPFLVSDAHRLSQVMLNLVGNALKFTEKGIVKVIISGSLVRDNERANVTFTVIDTGIGISPDKVENIFDSFQQEDTSTSRKYGGTGLGLAISKQLVSLLGGDLKVKSKKGVGSEFYFQLNLAVEAIDPDKDRVLQEEQVDLKGKRLLLAEDNLYNREFVLAILEKTGIEIEIAENGLQAIEALTKSSFDLILMDIQMPELSGLEATRIIRNELKLNTPIIALTANAMEGQKAIYLKEGMDEYLSKPFDPGQLTALIANILGKKRISPSQAGSAEPEVIEKLYSTHELLRQGNGNPAFLERMLKVFAQSTPEITEKLKMALDANDFSRACAIIHQLKPSVRMMKIDSIVQDVIQLGSGNPKPEDHPDWQSKANGIITTLQTAARQVAEELG